MKYYTHFKINTMIDATKLIVKSHNGRNQEQEEMFVERLNDDCLFDDSKFIKVKNISTSKVEVINKTFIISMSQGKVGTTEVCDGYCPWGDKIKKQFTRNYLFIPHCDVVEHHKNMKSNIDSLIYASCIVTYNNQ